MRQKPSARARANESKYPYIIELLVADDEVDVELGRRIMNFHRSRKLQARHGRRIVSEDYQIYFRWCFSDLATAQEFMEEFGGAVARPNAETLTRDEARRIAAKIARRPR